MEEAISERAASARSCPAKVAVFVFVDEPAIEVPPLKDAIAESNNTIGISHLQGFCKIF